MPFPGPNPHSSLRLWRFVPCTEATPLKPLQKSCSRDQGAGNENPILNPALWLGHCCQWPSCCPLSAWAFEDPLPREPLSWPLSTCWGTPGRPGDTSLDPEACCGYYLLAVATSLVLGYTRLPLQPQPRTAHVHLRGLRACDSIRPSPSFLLSHPVPVLSQNICSEDVATWL